MRRIFICCLAIFAINAYVSGQTINTTGASDTTKVYELFDSHLDVLPSFPGGQQELFLYLSKNINYPEAAKKKKITGTVAITFVLDETGTVTAVKVIRDIGGGCGEEALRVVSLMPKWIPSMVGGKPVKVRYTLPIRFKLE